MAKSIIDELIENIKGLPALPEVVSRVASIQIEATSAREIAKIIEKDSGISSRLLKIANSAYFGLTGDVSTVRMAATVLGVRLVKNLVLCASMIELFPSERFAAGSFALHWQYNCAVAAANRILAGETNYTDPDEAFAAGLLQHIGLMFLLTMNPGHYDKVLEEVPEGEFATPEMERRILGTDHTEAGVILAQHIGLPDVLLAPIRYHHEADKLPRNLSKAAVHLVRLNGLSDLVAQIFVLNEKGDLLDSVFDKAETWFNLKRETTAEVMGTTANEVGKVVRSFLLDIDPTKNYVEVLQQANTELAKETFRLLSGEKEPSEKKSSDKPSPGE